ncbi:VOC family protein [Actinosynnema sp. CA-248983]
MGYRETRSDAEVARLVGFGASIIANDPALPWVVLSDPAGDEFCVLPPPASLP